MKLLLVLFPFFCLICCTSTTTKEKSPPSNNPEFERIFPFALRGEMNKVFDILDVIDTKKLNGEELKLKNRYYSRFVHQSEVYDHGTEDSIIVKFVDLFHSYWNDVLMAKMKIEQADSLFVASMANFLHKHKYAAQNIPKNKIRDHIYTYSNEFLRAKGYFSNAFGKTAHLYDLFLWEREDMLNYSVELLRDSVDVTVHLMHGFISQGWSHYTTFGRNYASGWANREALFCMANAYDRNSENYKVSYLVHEGQHFYDYQKYPKLIQRDLEYRAKLMELIKSNTTTIQLVEKFIANAANQPENAHAFANFCIIRDLSKAIFSENYIIEKSKWSSVSSKLIREKSEKLYITNTKELDSIGPKVVTALIR